MPVEYFNCKKVISSNYADHAETFSGELVDFRNTRFQESTPQIEAESTN